MRASWNNLLTELGLKKPKSSGRSDAAPVKVKPAQGDSGARAAHREVRRPAYRPKPPVTSGTASNM
jgi:hypothetical protein